MDKLKIAVSLIGNDNASEDFLRKLREDPAMVELCSLCSPKDDTADAQVLVPATEPIKCPADAVEVIMSDKANIMPLPQEPTAEDIIRLRDILERDFDLRSPRIAIVRDSSMQNPDLASQVTTEQGINTYGPYTMAQFLGGNAACHFDCVITTDGETTTRRIMTELAIEVPVRVFAGKESVTTAACQPVCINDMEDGLGDVSAWTNPIYIAIDIVRNRASYDEARQNPLPKLYHDKREDRRREYSQQTNEKLSEPSPSGE